MHGGHGGVRSRNPFEGQTRKKRQGVNGEVLENRMER